MGSMIALVSRHGCRVLGQEEKTIKYQMHEEINKCSSSQQLIPRSMRKRSTLFRSGGHYKGHCEQEALDKKCGSTDGGQSARLEAIVAQVVHLILEQTLDWL